MNQAPDLSKSCFFTVQGDNVVLSEQPDRSSTQPASLDADTIIDQKYRILFLLGKGGMGEVYRAHHLMLDKDVALKTFSSGNINDESVLRFQREAQSIAKLNHKNVIQAFDFGISEKGIPYYTMEYLDGESLSDRLMKSGPLSVDKAIEFFVQICQGLSLAHSKGIIHRDLKPGNLFIASQTPEKELEETIKILDFGVASLVNQTLSAQKLTTRGAVFGSPLYMSPEQAMGGTVSERSDIYSLGCTLFEALAGKPPFRGATAHETIMLHQVKDAPTLMEASGGRAYPPVLERTVAMMLAKSPADRQASADQIAAELSSLGEGQGIEGNLPGTLRADPQTGQVSDAKVQNIGTRGETTPPRSGRLVKSLVALLLLSIGGILYWKGSVPTTNKTETVNSTTVPVDNHRRSDRQAIQPSADDLVRAEKRVRGRKSYLVFHCPPGASMGTIRVAGGIDCQIGSREFQLVSTPTGIFFPSEAFLKNPDNFAVFPPDFLLGVVMKDCQLRGESARIMELISRQRELTLLDLAGTEINNADLKQLEKLEKLSYLGLDDTGVSGAVLGRDSGIVKLMSLSLRRCREAGKVLTKLKHTNSLTGLTLDDDSLTQSDFETIGTFRNLAFLHVNRTGMSDDGFRALTSLKNLKGLEAQGCPITGRAMDSFRLFARNGLKSLKLSATELSQSDMRSILTAIPGAEFNYEIFREAPRRGDSGDLEEFLNQAH